MHGVFLKIANDLRRRRTTAGLIPAFCGRAFQSTAASSPSITGFRDLWPSDRDNALSGAHMNLAVSVVLWGARLLPGRHVPLYVTAQLAGSVAGTVLGRLAVGAPLSHPDVDFALLSPALPAPAMFIATGEGIATVILLMSVVRLAHTGRIWPGRRPRSSVRFSSR
ncbi:aquaporin [Streptomyces sp. NPDC056462]|uniref:aquaporin n=1 Tax=Streptomyces sp. NPDC056462 TaxID=3345826 RepID=UPI0036C55267